jgi:hypothetical protein
MIVLLRRVLGRRPIEVVDSRPPPEVDPDDLARWVQERDVGRLERSLKVGLHAHPYGTTPAGLITEVRVEMEAEWDREHEQLGGLCPPMAPLVDRLAAAREEARRRWPAYFVEADQALDEARAGAWFFPTMQEARDWLAFDVDLDEAVGTVRREPDHLEEWLRWRRAWCLEHGL